MDDFWDILKLMGICILIFALFFAVILVPISIADKTSCNAQTAEIGFAHRWAFWTGCQIEVTPGQWIPLDNYYFNQTEK